MGLELDKTLPVSRNRETKLINETETKSYKTNKQQQQGTTKIHHSAVLACFITVTVDLHYKFFYRKLFPWQDVQFLAYDMNP